MSTKDDLIAAIRAAEELEIRAGRKHYRDFIPLIKPDYDMQWFHGVIADKLQAFSEGIIKKMMILMPPQHGKTEIATRLFPPYLLGLNPDLKVAIASYAGSIASGFNRSIQRYMDNETYARIFPNTKLNNSQIFHTNKDGYTRTDKKFDIIEHKGSVKTVGRGGALTSETVDIGIIDDLFKDRAEARSSIISEAAWDWYVAVFKTRLHNDSQQLFMTTRWDEFDVAGRALDTEPGEWEVITFPAIRTEDVNEYDIRAVGEALYPSKHSLEKLLGVQKQSEIIFNALYQQNPRGISALLIYPEVYEIPELPESDYHFWGLDFGSTVSKTTLVKCVEDPENFYMDECCYQPSMSAKELHMCLVGNGYKSGQPVYCDHRPTTINELRLLGVNAGNAIKGEGSVEAGIIKMKEKKLWITKRSTNARRESNNYRWESINGIITQVPEKKGFEHFWDGARYARYTHFFQGSRR